MDLLVSVEDFIKWLDNVESGELSHLDIPDDPTIYKPKIEIHLIDAQNEFFGALPCINNLNPPQFIINVAPTWIKRIARKTLDYLNPRESVEADYQRFYNEFVPLICPPLKAADASDIIPESDTIMAIFSA